MSTREVNDLTLTCQKCKISKFCGSNGSSPLRDKQGVTHFCTLIAGYATQEIPSDILSEEAKKLKKQAGDFVSFAQVPQMDKSSNLVYYQSSLIFHPEINHPRKKARPAPDAIFPQSTNRAIPRK